MKRSPWSVCRAITRRCSAPARRWRRALLLETVLRHDPYGIASRCLKDILPPRMLVPEPPEHLVGPVPVTELDISSMRLVDPKEVASLVALFDVKMACTARVRHARKRRRTAAATE